MRRGGQPLVGLLSRGLRPGEGATTARARGGLGLLATVRQQVLRVRRDPDVGQERTRAAVTPCHARVGPTTPKSANRKLLRPIRPTRARMPAMLTLWEAPS